MSGANQPVGRILGGDALPHDQLQEVKAVPWSNGWGLVLAEMRARMFFPDPNEADRYLFALFGYASAIGLFETERKLTAVELHEADADIETYSDLDYEARNVGARTPAKAGTERWIHAGLITAYILLIPLAVQVRSGKKVGRQAAFRVLTSWLCDRNGMVGAKKRSLQEIWQKYQSVACLWATYNICRTFPKSGDDLIHFLAIADYFRQLGESYRPERSRETLLDPRITWKVVPEIQLPTVKPDWSSLRLPEKWMHKATETCSDN